MYHVTIVTMHVHILVTVTVCQQGSFLKNYPKYFNILTRFIIQ